VRQIGLAIHNFHDTFGCLPPGKVTNSGYPNPAHNKFQIPSGVSHGWGVFILPFMEQKNLSDVYRWDKNWNATENTPVISTHVKTLVCPSTPNGKRKDGTAACGDYGVVNKVDPVLGTLNLIDLETKGALDGAMRSNELQRFADITDGLSNTTWLVEDAARPVRYTSRWTIVSGSTTGGGWADPENEFSVHGFSEDCVTEGNKCGVNCCNRNEIFGFHPGGANIMLGDGAVRFLTKGTDIRIVARLVTRGAGEVVTIPEG